MSFSIGEVARLAGCCRSSIRAYENMGLLNPGRRDRSNYRKFSDEDAARARFIVWARAQGFSLAEIEALFKWRENPKDMDEEARHAAAELKNRLDEQIASLTKLRDELAELGEGADPI